MGALTLTKNQEGIIGDLRYTNLDVAFSNSYAAGGDTGLTAAALGWNVIYLVIMPSDDGFTYRYDYTNGTVLAYRIDVVAGTGTQGVNTDLMKSGTSTLEVTGAGTAFQVALGQVTAAVDLSTTPGTIRCLVFGR